MYYCKSFAKSKFDVKYVNTEINNLVGTCVFKINRMLNRTKHLKTNRLQKTIEYKTNEQSTKYSNST